MSAFESSVRPSLNSRRVTGVMLVLLGLVVALLSDSYAEEGSEPNQPNAALFESTGENLLRALVSANSEDRKVHLRMAQSSIDKVDVPNKIPLGGASNSAFSQFGREVEASISKAEAAITKSLYLSLMRLIWESPYSTSPDKELESLETVADALETLYALTKQDSINLTGIAQIQSAYWAWLEARREQIGLGASAIEETTNQPVFDQRVVVSDSGRPEIYQLVGTDNKRIRWQIVDGTKIGSTINVVGSLSLDLSSVRAPWVIIISGSNLSQYLTPHLSWFESLREQSLVILIERDDFAGLLRDLPIGLSAQGQDALYLLPGDPDSSSSSIILINSLEQEALAQWPTANLSHDRADVLKSILAKVTSSTTNR